MYKLVVLSSVLALAAAAPSAIAPLGLAGLGHLGLGHLGLGHLGLAGPLVSPLAAPLVAPHVGPAVALGAPSLHAYNYRGPLSLAPGQPANILAADGRPLDTLSVNLDRAAHLTARAVDHSGLHILKKRSAPLLGAPWGLPHAGLLPAARVIAPVPVGLHGAPLGLHAPVAPIAPIGLGHGWGHGAPLGHLW